MKCSIFPHLDGIEVLGQDKVQDIRHAIETCPVCPGRGSSMGIKDHVFTTLGQKGWSGEIQIEPTVSKISIPSAKDQAGLCFQTGNMGRAYADLVKLQALYLNAKIEVGALILPTRVAAKKMNSNLANYDRLKVEMSVIRKVIYMPIVLFSFE